MQTRKAFTSGVLAVAITILTLFGATAAQAETPVTFGADRISDTAGVLGSSTGTVKDAITTLADEHQVNLYVAYVDSFESPADAKGWAQTTARQNGLGARDYLLAVSVGGRSYYLLGDSAGPLTNAQLTEIEKNLIEPRLRANDWPGAATAAAKGIGDAVGSTAGSGGAPASNGAPARSNGWGGFLGFIIVVLVIGGALLFVRSRRARSTAAVPPTASTAAPAPQEEVIPLQELERRASAALIGVDDALQASTQEVGFAEAQYGQDAARPFAEAVEGARARLKSAFALKQKLDDDVPDTDQERRAWNGDIIRLASEARDLLTEQEDAFAQLRAFEKDIPGKVRSVRAGVTASQSRVSHSETALKTLAAAYAASALTTVRDNPAQAAERLTFAETALADAEAKAASGAVSEAAVSARAAEAALGQANLLLDAVDRVAQDLAAATATVDSGLADLKRDIADARALAAAGDPTGAVMAAERSAESAAGDVQARLAAGHVDPRELIQKLELINREIDGVLGAVRDRQASEQRANASLGQVLASAQARVQAAGDFIAARRGAVGADARTRLAEATRLLGLAQSAAATDSVSALAQAQRADQLAAEAIQLADNDVNGFASSNGVFGMPGGMMGGMMGGGRRGVGPGGIVGAVLGGILIDSVLRGGGGGGYGGGYFNGGFGGGYGGGGWGDGDDFNAGGYGGGGGDFGGGGGGDIGGGGDFGGGGDGGGGSF